ncbi:MAG: hypothetical protein DMG65_08920 [Candidatus Angelobacter sp. Gp1-AA117]|nr:MAG: hypothetical protein DMG65_08920 [Candidatus Angelobacter sp. Gp1-AA117]
MKIIILSPDDDNHTAPIQWALEKAGYTVACWMGLAWTEAEQASLRFGRQTRVALGPHIVEPGDVVWIRRPELPAANPNVSEADRKFAELEYRGFYHSIAYVLEKLPVWVINRYSFSRFIIHKAVQLVIAGECGLKVAETLMSNSPAPVRDFVANNPHRVICKAFTQHVWERSDHTVAVTETFELQRDRLPRDEVLTYAPAIYQDLIEKQFDVRMVIMGCHVYSYALHNPEGSLDWRQDAGQRRIRVDRIATPPEIERAVLAFTQETGICFGSLDFAVDRQGEWWFLEINEQGQFLWLDQFNPELKVQEKFCAFITAPQGSTEPLEKREGLFPPLAEYEELVLRKELPPVDIKVSGSAGSMAFVSSEG